MNKTSVVCATLLLTVSAMADTNKNAARLQQTAPPQTTSLKEMLATGPAPLKLHAMTILSRESNSGAVDETYLPAFKACASDPDDLVRSMTAKMLGAYYIAGKETANPEAIALLVALARDKSAMVRYNAVYYGLSVLEEKPREVIELLIDTAKEDRDTLMNKRIGAALEKYRKETTEILNEKLRGEKPIAYFEIYESLTGEPAEGSERFMELPSSRPVMFVFAGKGDSADTAKADLEKELKGIGLTNPELSDAGTGTNYILILKTYLTSDRVAVETAFADTE